VPLPQNELTEDSNRLEFLLPIIIGCGI